ncbi:MAG: hypothetical protein LC772_10685, partial [Chloroflexi bacterium]|nr:hypothetical protein [Chloroflexota bacterium]
MAGQRLEIAARLIRRAIIPVSLATLVALPMVAAQTAGGGQPPAANASGGGTTGRGNRGGGRFGGGRRRGGRGTGPAFGRVPGTGVPAVTIEGGGPAGPVVAAPSTFRIATPSDGTMVRGVVAVQVPAGSMEDGSYVSFAINDPLSSTPGQGLQFATVRNSNSGTFVWDWDTRAVGTDGNPIFPDKNYTIYVTAHD